MELRRLESFRKGDRAETLGIFLLQSFCAIAEVPREEDFGLMDAVATLLRRQDRFLIAEDSFLVQFKSRTETTVEFFDGRFKALIGQDLPLILGHVDLLAGSLELHTLGVALAHPNINSISGIVTYLQGNADKAGLVDDALHVVFNKPIIRMTISDTESIEFTRKAYEILKEWLTLERWNRRYRRSGITRQFRWETNEVPTENGTSYLWSPTKARDALEDFAPFVPVLSAHAQSNVELRVPALAIMAWLRGHGVESDPGGISTTLIGLTEAGDRLKKALDAHPDADIAYSFQIIGASEGHLDIWLSSRDRDGRSGGVRHTGSLAHIQEKGIVASIEVADNQAQVFLGFSDEWLSAKCLESASTPCVAIPSVVTSQSEDILLLRRVRKTEGGD